jgi:hypothetical protein
MMPRLDGLDVCRISAAAEHLPILVLTGPRFGVRAVAAWTPAPTTTCQPFARRSCWPGCGRCCGAERDTRRGADTRALTFSDLSLDR